MKREATLFAPLLVSIALGFLIGEGHLNFGGGEKDLLLLIPLLAFALIFLVTGLVIWKRSPEYKTWVKRTTVYSVEIALVLWLCLLLLSFGGIV